MKINHDNMQELASKLDSHLTFADVDISEDDVCSMAYQIQYFFEAKEEIEKHANANWNDVRRTVWRQVLKILDNALIHKEE